MQRARAGKKFHDLACSRRAVSGALYARSDVRDTGHKGPLLPSVTPAPGQKVFRPPGAEQTQPGRYHRLELITLRLLEDSIVLCSLNRNDAIANLET
eukprot:COSAG02_NODE_807_length_16930_cov_21.113719_6_plen_97_part_00